MINKLELRFVDIEFSSLMIELQAIYALGVRNLLVRQINAHSDPLIDRLVRKNANFNWLVLESESTAGVPSGFTQITDLREVDACLLLFQGEEILSLALLDCIDLPGIIVVAPITKYYFLNRPLFITTIPKSGTHLLLELLKAFKYRAGIDNTGALDGGHWYHVGTTPHYSARDFLRDHSVHPRDHRYHEFVDKPAIFMFRNPLDIVVSEANYHARENNPVLHAAYGRLSFEERMCRVINDRWLMPDLRDRMGGFIPWLDFPNVISVSFEELVGPEGGGSEVAQTQIIWSLQLKLHVPGDPRKYGQACFNKHSPTFHTGRIGAFHRHFTAAVFDQFLSLPQDFMTDLGYEPPRKTDNGFTADPMAMSRHAERLRHRPLSFSGYRSGNNPMAAEYGYLGYNIIRFQGKFYAIQQVLGDLDLRSLSQFELETLLQDNSVAALKQRIFLQNNTSEARFEESPDAPYVLEIYNGYQIARFANRYFAVPEGFDAGSLALIRNDDLAFVLSSELLSVVKRLTDSPPDPRLVTSILGYNVVAHKGLFYGVPQQLGNMDLRSIDLRGSIDVFVEIARGLVVARIISKVGAGSNAAPADLAQNSS